MCELWITRLEYIQCRMLVADTGREAPQAGIDFFRAAGWEQEDLDKYVERFGALEKRYRNCRIPSVAPRLF